MLDGVDGKKQIRGLIVNVSYLLIGAAVGAMLVSLAGCGQGPVWLGAGLVIEDLLEGDVAPADGENGLSCWDLDGSGACDAHEDIDGDGYCTAIDCQGPSGLDGVDGSDGDDGNDGVDGEASTIPGPVGPQGPPGPTTVIIIQPPVDEPEESEPPFGRGPDGNGPPGHRP